MSAIHNGHHNFEIASNFHSMPWCNAGLPYSHKKKIECHPHSQTLPSYRPNVGNWKKLKGRILSWPILTRSSYTGQTNGTSYKEEVMEMQSLHQQENTVWQMIPKCNWANGWVLLLCLYSVWIIASARSSKCSFA